LEENVEPDEGVNYLFPNRGRTDDQSLRDETTFVCDRPGAGARDVGSNKKLNTLEGDVLPSLAGPGRWEGDFVLQDGTWISKVQEQGCREKRLWTPDRIH